MAEAKTAELDTLKAFNALAKSALKARPLCIAGMHRSGTSLTASWLAKCGLYVGQDLGPSSVSNPKGHFEDQEFVLFQASAIGRTYPKSQGWKVTDARFLRFNEVEEMQAREFVKERSKEHAFWGWKDPRSVLFLEHWREISPDMKYFLIWRPYVDVVESLLRRAEKQKIDLVQVNMVQALRIWVAHNQLVAEFKRRYPKDTILLSTRTVQSKPEAAFDLLKKKLQVNLNYEPVSSLVDASIWHEAKEPSLRLKAMATIFGAYALEKKLADLSDFH